MIETTLTGKTPDIGEENIKKLMTMFPEVVTEGKVDFEKLKQVLGEYVDDSNERYNFTWNGKGRALRLSQTPSLGTLRPCKEESKDWDTTQNLYIEGDNLEVLKLLQKSYYGKVKMIYIDPPYNTGKDFVYRDDFHDSLENYKRITGQVDGNGKAISTNTETSGRYHTDWLNMMYPRLRLARNLLSDDGVVFISIGQEEIANAVKVSDEVFGEHNRISIICRVTKTASNNGTFFAPTIDFVLCYARSISNVKGFVDVVDESLYKKIEKEGPRAGERYRDDVALYQASLKDIRPNQKYFIECPDGSKVIPPCSVLDEVMREGDGRWRWTKEKYLQNKHLLVFKRTNNSPLLDENGNRAKWNVYTKSYLSDRQEAGTLPRELWADFINRKGADLLKRMSIPFDFSKPVELIEYMMQITSTDKDCIILDFFSGSATTAHAVMQLNAKDGGNRRFIMVQLPEPTEENSEAYKAGYMNISDIGKERIRRAGEKIKEDYKDKENIENLDIGFKVFKLDTSNIRKWQPDYDNLEQSLMDYVDNFMEGRTEFDVVYEIMLKYGLDLTYPVDEFTIAGKKVYSIGYGMLMICLDNEITTEVAKGILTKIKELSPESSRVVFKDNGFKSDSNKTNIKEILKSGGIEEFITI
ncbi:site-specific DNA-methyltransferase [Pseudoclostridium thermosuccinogenes]|uniref:site-specific DNA-methyltransferase n=1 Tax=Clostridium thermosuccinogenes TaxID=84032 RepID=UPI002FDA9E4E